MPDARAMILDRLEVLLGEIEDAPSVAVYRNRGELPPDKRPCMVLLDGIETVHQNHEGRAGRVWARNSPSVMILEPQIFAILKARPLDKSEEYADQLTAYRNGIVRAILNDTELLVLTGENGDIAYRGHETDMQTGSSMEGQIQMNFRFYYVLDPSNL